MDKIMEEIKFPVDKDGVPIIKGELCANSDTIRDAMHTTQIDSDHNKMLRKKLYIALRLRKEYEKTLKARGR